MFHNRDSTDPFYYKNLQAFMCQNCKATDTCAKLPEMPLVSQFSRYMLRWHSEQQVVPSYPLPGTWEDQPAWFSNLMSAITTRLRELEFEEQERNKKNAR